MINRYSQKWIPFGYKGYTMWPFIFYYDAQPEDWLVRHEEYHYWHQFRWFVIPWYVVYWVMYMFYGYDEHPWEILAREAEWGS